MLKVSILFKVCISLGEIWVVIWLCCRESIKVVPNWAFSYFYINFFELSVISPKTYNQQHLRCKTSLPSLKDREKMTTSIKKFGQPTPETHPHMLKSGELIQGVMLKEIQLRRERLMVNIQNFIAKSGMNIKNHLVCSILQICLILINL